MLVVGCPGLLGGADILVCHLINFPKGNPVNSRGWQPTDLDNRRLNDPERVEHQHSTITRPTSPVLQDDPTLSPSESSDWH